MLSRNSCKPEAQAWFQRYVHDGLTQLVAVGCISVLSGCAVCGSACAVVSSCSAGRFRLLWASHSMTSTVFVLCLVCALGMFFRACVLACVFLYSAGVMAVKARSLGNVLNAASSLNLGVQSSKVQQLWRGCFVCGWGWRRFVSYRRAGMWLLSTGSFSVRCWRVPS